MKLRIDEKTYQEWKDKQVDPDDPEGSDYGLACFRYAEAWADLMEARMADGAELEDIAKQTSREADTEGITGFMYGMAVKILAHSWEHGERLRIWHNLDTQIRDEGERANEGGGVLNPAILKLGDGDHQGTGKDA